MTEPRTITVTIDDVSDWVVLVSGLTVGDLVAWGDGTCTVAEGDTASYDYLHAPVGLTGMHYPGRRTVGVSAPDGTPLARMNIDIGTNGPQSAI
jgi:hypothetical protein